MGKTFFTKGLEWLTAIIFIEFTAVTFAQVIARYVFGSAFFWAEELTRFSLIWLTFLGASLAASNNNHIRIGFIIDNLPGRVRALFTIVAKLLCVFFMGYTTFYSLDYVTYTLSVEATSLKIPMAVIYSIFPISGILIIFFYLTDIFTTAKDLYKSVITKEVG